MRSFNELFIASARGARLAARSRDAALAGEIFRFSTDEEIQTFLCLEVAGLGKWVIWTKEFVEIRSPGLDGRKIEVAFPARHYRPPKALESP